MDELHPINITGTEVGTARCDAGDWKEDAADAAGVQPMLWHAAMHAAATGHDVHEVVQRSITVHPAPA